jgi:fermentation-respiration switch protein FrsA (DUF1100 family)
MESVVFVAASMVVALYCILVGTLALHQRRFLYVPRTNRPDLSATGLATARALTVCTEDGLGLLAWLVPAADATQPMVLYLHGNGGNIASRAARFAALHSFGWGVLLLEYRGFGGNPGTPTEAGLYEDARAGYAALRTLGIPARRIVLWGESLGSGVAVRLASAAEVGLVLLESPYTSILAIGQKRFPLVPVSWLLRDRFDLIGRIAEVRAPVLVMTGARDVIVPPAMGRAVFAAANDPKAFWLAPDAGHDDLVEAGAFDAVRAFVSQHWSTAA